MTHAYSLEFEQNARLPYPNRTITFTASTATFNYGMKSFIHIPINSITDVLHPRALLKAFEITNDHLKYNSMEILFSQLIILNVKIRTNIK